MLKNETCEPGLPALYNINLDKVSGYHTTIPDAQVLLEAVVVARRLLSHLKGYIKVHVMHPLFFSILSWLGHQGLKRAGGNISIYMHLRKTLFGFSDSQSNILLVYTFCLSNFGLVRTLRGPKGVRRPYGH